MVFVYNVLITDGFEWNNIKGKLYFGRYQSNNPALILKTQDDKVITDFSEDLPEFFSEYPFGDYSLVAVKDEFENSGVIQLLQHSGIIREKVFNYFSNGIVYAICELSWQVIDLLKSNGEYYV